MIIIVNTIKFLHNLPSALSCNAEEFGDAQDDSAELMAEMSAVCQTTLHQCGDTVTVSNTAQLELSH